MKGIDADRSALSAETDPRLCCAGAKAAAEPARAITEAAIFMVEYIILNMDLDYVGKIAAKLGSTSCRRNLIPLYDGRGETLDYPY